MKHLDKLLDLFEEYACFITLTIMTVAVFLQIVNRSFLARPFPWGEELARYMMIWAIMLGTSAGVKIGAHVGVNTFVDMIPGRAKVIFTLGTGIVALAFYVLVSILAVQLVVGIQRTGQLSPALRIPVWLAYLALPVGFAFCVCRQAQLVLVIVNRLRMRTSEAKKEPAITEKMEKGGPA